MLKCTVEEHINVNGGILTVVLISCLMRDRAAGRV
jgi:hypothetical protein